MLLSEYIKKLQEVEEKHGGNLKVVYSIDDEGNAYHGVFYEPSLGNFSRTGDEWSPLECTEPDRKPDSVCIN